MVRLKFLHEFRHTEDTKTLPAPLRANLRTLRGMDGSRLQLLNGISSISPRVSRYEMRGENKIRHAVQAESDLLKRAL